jgi:hypothetical protein
MIAREKCPILKEIDPIGEISAIEVIMKLI